MAEDKASPRRIEAAEKRREALKLRKAGATYEAIAAKVGFTNKGSAQRAVTQALKDVPKDDAEVVFALELERLDQLLLALWPQAMKGHVRSAETVIRLMERRAKLHGLDAPEKISATVTHASADVDAAVAELAREMALRSQA